MLQGGSLIDLKQSDSFFCCCSSHANIAVLAKVSGLINQFDGPLT